MRKRVIAIAAALLATAVALAAAGLHLPTLLGLGPGYSAHLTCSCMFVSGRTAESCAGDLDPLARRSVSISTDPSGRSVTATSALFIRRTARYRDGYGCSLDD